MISARQVKLMPSTFFHSYLKWNSRFFLVYSNRNLAPLSPYLNFDPSYLQSSQPEFIFPEGASRHRGRFELAFSTIGGMCMIGGGIGGVTGLVKGMKDTAAAGHTGKLRRTQYLFNVLFVYLNS